MARPHWPPAVDEDGFLQRDRAACVNTAQSGEETAGRKSWIEAMSASTPRDEPLDRGAIKRRQPPAPMVSEAVTSAEAAVRVGAGGHLRKRRLKGAGGIFSAVNVGRQFHRALIGERTTAGLSLDPA